MSNMLAYITSIINRKQVDWEYW